MKKNIPRLLLVLALVALPAAVQAQVGTVEGTVLDPQGVPLQGANVSLRGTTVGAATDTNGDFRLTVPVGEHTLLVSFLGFADYEAPIMIGADETLRLEIRLEEGGINLDEVVVTALGLERQERSIGYSFQEVESDVIERANESNLVNALAGKVAGMQVSSASGQPGRAARIIIRGNSSMTGNNQPLFVIDGVPISNEEANITTEENPEGSALFTGGSVNRGVDIDPSIIQDITVLKGASAMALYGSRAANGAILITTKGGRGQQGLRITFTNNTRFDSAIIDGFQQNYTLGADGCFANGLPASQGGVSEECFGPVSQTVWNWGPHIDSLNADPARLQELGIDPVQRVDPRRDFYQSGATFENSLNISGGLLGGNFFVSASNLGQDGIVPGTRLDRSSFMAKFGGNLTPSLLIESSINYVRTENAWAAEGNGALSYLYALNFAPPNFDITQPTFEDGTQRMFTTSLNNPFWLVDRNLFTSDVDRFIGSVNVAYDVLPWLTVSERLGIDSYADTRKGRVDVGTRGRLQGSMYDQVIGRREINSDLIARANRRIGDDVGIDLIVGNNINSQYYQRSYLRGVNLGVPGFFHINNAQSVSGDEYLSRRALIGVYSQATIDYDDWAYLTLTARNDWSSTLPSGNNSFFYPSVGIGLVFTEPIDFFRDTPLSYGKLRASWARIGNDAPVYSTMTAYVQPSTGDGQRGVIEYPFNNVIAYQESNQMGNPGLRPELSSEYELGLDLRFFGQRGRIDLSYYDRTTTDQIFSVPVSAATGFVARLMNAGELRNYGFEAIVGVTPFQTRDFSWDLTANFARNRHEVISLAEGVESIFLGGFNNPQIRIQEGEGGYGVIWGDQFARADREIHADLFEANPELREGTLLIGGDGLPIVSDALGAIGNVQPDWTANLRTSLSYRGLSASALLDVRRGGDVMNMDLFYSSYYGSHAVTEDRGTTYVYDGFNVDTGAMNDVEVVRDQDFYQGFWSFYAENWVEDGSFVKLRELSLSYSLPTPFVQRGGIQAATITATGRNLWIGTDFSYGDPEGSLLGSGNAQGFYHMVTPSTRSYALGIRVTI